MIDVRVFNPHAIATPPRPNAIEWEEAAGGIYGVPFVSKSSLLHYYEKQGRSYSSTLHWVTVD